MSENNQKLRYAGDVLIQELKLISYTGFEVDLLGLFTEIEIYEDLFASCISGTVFVAESVNLLQHVPIVGHERLVIRFSTPSAPEQKHEFYVYGVTDKVQLVGDTGTAYGINFVSREQLQSNVIKISKSYLNMRVSDIVSTIFTENLVIPSDKLQNKLFYEQTDGVFSCVIPYWNPIYAINWLATYARSFKYPNQPTYLFFQNLDGFQFRPVSSFYEQEPSETYMYKPSAFLRDKAGVLNPTDAIINIIDYVHTNSQDKLQASCDGTYMSESQSLDLVYKRVNVINYSYPEQFSETKHLNKYPVLPTVSPYTAAAVAHRNIFGKHSMMFDGNPDATQKEFIVGHREAFFKQMSYESLVINIPGDSRRRVGDTVRVLIPSRENIVNKESDVFDVRLSGNYIIKSLCHYIRDNNHTMKMMLTKDSIGTPIPYQKDKSLGNSRA